MQTIAFAVPLPADKKERFLKFAQLLRNERNADFRRFLERLDTVEENWFLQPFGEMELFICYLAAPDLQAAFGKLASSQHPFDKWIKQENKEIFGMDFESPSDDPMPEVLLQCKVEPIHSHSW
ncbi:DUF6176 family protein [Pseudomonas sessilinigenes]|uniref:Uncharacterized protein n=1 Tax=Pseudomonas sessilinigenes TaxID=658629 RepID=H9NJ33_9PSED|nr:DUF6176 family protein [Pseudomonas sessilinigenes]AFF59665.1 hypothetical protein [Pseudomonas sessilinigenes]AZC23617.1 hypothetical protein C4K39_1933 [Pseudomonas sessilinigenes]QXH42611.1 hypothetical protein KSS89_10420 [Pseudomonas sessilinigenes]